MISRLYKTEPINYDCPVSGISLAGSFADEWSRQNQEDSMGLIPCAEGGSSLGEWSVDGVLFRHAITEAKFAMQISELTGILWHQGESDSNNDNYKVYYEKLLISRFVLKK
nr:sialate O-acetylesterase [Amphibacillus cookii]